jgi:hypothetical protein
VFKVGIVAGFGAGSVRFLARNLGADVTPFFSRNLSKKCDFFKMTAGLVLDSRFSNGTIERFAGPVRRWTIELCGDHIARPAHRYQFPTVALQIRIFLRRFGLGGPSLIVLIG